MRRVPRILFDPPFGSDFFFFYVLKLYAFFVFKRLTGRAGLKRALRNKRQNKRTEVIRVNDGARPPALFAYAIYERTDSPREPERDTRRRLPATKYLNFTITLPKRADY